MSFADIFNEKITKRIIETKTWINNKDKKDLNHDLNKIDVFLLHKDKKQNGDRKTKILISIYLIPYVIIKFKKPIETIECNIPSIEKMFVDEFAVEVRTEFNFKINVEKHILSLNKVSPSPLMLLERIEIKYIISSQIKNEKFIRIEHKSSLNKKENGFSTSVRPK